MNGAMGLMLDTLQVQTTLLRRLSEYATEEPASSPVTKILGELTSAIMELDASIGGLDQRFGNLSDAISAASRGAPNGSGVSKQNGSAS
jgi:hypothetical protein